MQKGGTGGTIRWLSEAGLMDQKIQTGGRKEFGGGCAYMVQIAVSRSVLSVVLWLSLFHAVGGSAGECSCRVSWRECKILWIRSGSDSHTFRRNLCQVERRMAGTAEDVHAQSPGQGHHLACRETTTPPPPPPPPPPPSSAPAPPSIYDWLLSAQTPRT